MRVVYYPDLSCVEDESGPLNRFFRDLSKERPPQLLALVRAILDKVERSSNLDDLLRQGVVAKMKHSRKPIFEFRIPPKKRKQGVARLYFAYKKNQPDTIVILSAEKKHQRKKADDTKIKQAETRYDEVCL